MSLYSLFNLVLGLLFGAASVLLVGFTRWHRLAARISVLMVLAAYPWDFFAIHLQVWAHHDPGPRLFTVPVNDLIFIFICTYLTVCVLVRFRGNARVIETPSPNTQDTNTLPTSATDRREANRHLSRSSAPPAN